MTIEELYELLWENIKLGNKDVKVAIYDPKTKQYKAVRECNIHFGANSLHPLLNNKAVFALNRNLD